MSKDSSHVPDSAIGNDTNSILDAGEIVHLDAPYDGWIMVCGFLIAMVLVAFIIILVAFTIRSVYDVSCSLCSSPTGVTSDFISCVQSRLSGGRV
ncbi:hypothetical protein WDU94_011024 [Cyamophila willieti]